MELLEKVKEKIGGKNLKDVLNVTREPHEEKHGNTKFLVEDCIRAKRPMKFYVNGSYEGPRIYVNARKVFDFSMLQPDQTLDLTWMKSDDYFDFTNLKDNVQYRNLKNIVVNVQNLGKSNLSEQPNENFNLNLIIKGVNKDKFYNSEDKLCSFFEYHENIKRGVKSVTLVDFDKTTFNSLASYLHDQLGVEVNKCKKFNIRTNLQSLKSESLFEKPKESVAAPIIGDSEIGM